MVRSTEAFHLLKVGDYVNLSFGEEDVLALLSFLVVRKSELNIEFVILKLKVGIAGAKLGDHVTLTANEGMFIENFQLEIFPGNM